MPIPVVCPGCGAKMNAPDTAAGRKVRCPGPDCRAVAAVPAAAAEPDPDPFGGLGRDDADDRPPRRRRGTSGGGKTGVAAAVAVGAVLLLGGGGFLAYRLSGGEKPAVPAGESKAAVPAGWTEYTSDEDGFRAYFPKKPEVIRDGVRNGPRGAPAELSMGGKGWCTVYTSGGPDDPVRVEVIVSRYSSGIPHELRRELVKGVDEIQKFAPAGSGVEARWVRWFGEQAAETVTPNYALRQAVSSNTFYQARVGGRNHTRARLEDEAAFFDNFTRK